MTHLRRYIGPLDWAEDARDHLRGTGVPVVRVWEDPASGAVAVSCEGGHTLHVDVSTFAHSDGYKQFTKAVKQYWEDATIALRYLARPRPRLGSGTVGYARRRR